MSSSYEKSNFVAQISQLLTNRTFIYNILGVLLFILVVIFGVLQWLKIYTNHGQKLDMPNYIDQHITDAQDDATSKSFEMIVNDSVHIVGKPGGLIQNQNPNGGSQVKEDRKIYVTTTKYNPDVIELKEPILPMYGKDYESLRKQLQQKAIASEIKDFKYDPLTTGTILEVWHGNEKISSSNIRLEAYKIERGSRLKFVVSSHEGGSFVIPNVEGLTYARAIWTIENSKFSVGEVTYANDLGIEDLNKSIIVRQNPVADGSKLAAGLSINLVVKAP